jgi:hypothetical protein
VMEALSDDSLQPRGFARGLSLMTQKDQ